MNEQIYNFFHKHLSFIILITLIILWLIYTSEDPRCPCHPVQGHPTVKLD